MTLRNVVERAKLGVLKSQRGKGLIPMFVGLAILVAFKTMLATLEPGMISWLAALPPLIVIAITALARVNDIGPEKVSWPWQMRRMGLIMTGGGAVTFMAKPFSDFPAYPTWMTVLLLYGFALTWFTTPGMPPWYKYITGERKPTEETQGKINDNTK